VPLDEFRIAVKRCSEDSLQTLVHDFKMKLHVTTDYVLQYVACVYEAEWWVGIILEIDKDQGDVRIDFMHPHGPSQSFYWPHLDDICWVLITHIFCGVEVPSTATGRQYNLREKDKKN